MVRTAKSAPYLGNVGSELFWKPASQKRLPATGLESPLARSVSTTPRLQAAPDDGEHTGR